MYTIEIEKECSCFKKSGFENNLTFENKEDAIMKAKVLECRMNQEFCFKHFFEAVDYGDKIVIHSTERPDDDEEYDEDLDIKKLMAKNKVTIGFNAEEEPPSSGNG
jgi:hypothetical protein